ncbi:hypothetical protein I6G79_28795 [Burkholderia plantarii]|nr:hypothetical protein [Burkholderia plantarii]
MKARREEPALQAAGFAPYFVRHPYHFDKPVPFVMPIEYAEFLINCR